MGLLDQAPARTRSGSRGESRGRRNLSATLLTLIALSSSACSPAYVLRAAWEEGKILWRREPIPEVLARPDLEPQARDRLELILDVRRFAADALGFAVGGAYGDLARVDSSALLHVVSASRKDRLEAYRWWFPIVGEVEYKGFFDEADAKEEAARLEREGWDVWVRTTIAFSTLGWFDDPVLSSWLRRSRGDVAETLIHELLHRTWYVNGQTSFNESMANFFGHQGAIQYFASRGATTDRDQVEAAWNAERALSRVLGEVLAELDGLYARERAAGATAAQIEAARQPLFDRLRAAADAIPGGGGAFARTPINNAVLLAQRAYLRDLDRFELVYREQGGDLRTTLAHLRALPAVPDLFTELPPADPAAPTAGEPAAAGPAPREGGA